MVADALGFNLYNNSKGASFVCFYPSSEDGTSNWAGKDWTEYQNEVHKGYSLSASMAQVEEKFGPNGLNIPEWLLNTNIVFGSTLTADVLFVVFIVNKGAVSCLLPNIDFKFVKIYLNYLM